MCHGTDYQTCLKRLYCCWPVGHFDMLSHKFSSRRWPVGKINNMENIPCSFFHLLKVFRECLFNWLLIYRPLRRGAGQLGLLTQHVWCSFLLVRHTSELGYTAKAAVMKLGEGFFLGVGLGKVTFSGSVRPKHNRESLMRSSRQMKS